ncbi:MAG TPA: hypothetical protein VH592_09315 [Gemmataceae bacterium]|jgi:hypothetical protein
MTPFVRLQKINAMPKRSGNHDRPTTPAQRSATTQPRLEQLEDRLAPATFGTVTDLTMWINPSFSEMGIERLTAFVTQAGTNAPVTSGNVVFSINNIPVGTAKLTSTGFAQIDTAVPKSALSTTQTVQAVYEGATVGTNTFSSSGFVSPVFLNVFNTLVTSFINFPGGPLNPSNPSVNANGSNSNLGQNDALLFFQQPSPTGDFFVIVHYMDPGVITSIMSFSPTLS